MNKATRVITALLIIGLLVFPALLEAQKLAVPKDRTALPDRTLLPGVTTLTYAGKTLTFTTAVALQIKLRVPAAGQVEVLFRRHPNWAAWPPPPGAAAPAVELNIFWDDFGEYVFGGNAPSGEWGGVVLSEGGWTEK